MDEVVDGYAGNTPHTPPNNQVTMVTQGMLTTQQKGYLRIESNCLQYLCAIIGLVQTVTTVSKLADLNPSRKSAGQPRYP